MGKTVVIGAVAAAALAAPLSASAKNAPTFSIGTASHVVHRFEQRDWHGRSHLIGCRWVRVGRVADCTISAELRVVQHQSPGFYTWTDRVTRSQPCEHVRMTGPRSGVASGSTSERCFTGPLRVLPMRVRLGAANPAGHTETCLNGYCVHGPYPPMTLQTARADTLRYERWFNTGPDIHSVRVLNCRWQQQGTIAHCPVRVSMNLFTGGRGLATVAWTDAVNRHGLAWALPYTGHILGPVRATEPSPRERV